MIRFSRPALIRPYPTAKPFSSCPLALVSPIGPGWGEAHVYPGTIGGKHWDKARIEPALKPVFEFQKTFNVHIHVGEFSAIRWVPDNSADRYLRDCVDIFEAHDWDWTYHAFREGDGWSVEHGEDRENRERSQNPTDRQSLMMDWISKNQKPAAASFP